MKKEGYQIGEVSKITGIPKDTLHFYIKSGLLTPDYVDPENHYNYFSRWNMYQLDILMTCRNLGVPLKKVRQILSSRDNQKVVNLLKMKKEILEIGTYALRVISLSFLPSGITIVITAHLQGITRMKESIFIIVLRQVFLLVPLAWVFHFAGLRAVWWTFPVTECIAALACFWFEKRSGRNRQRKQMAGI